MGPVRKLLWIVGNVVFLIAATAVAAIAIDDELDPARNVPLACEAVNTPGAVPRAAFNMTHLANMCGIVGTDVEFQSRVDDAGAVRDYAFVGTMGYGFRIYEVTDPTAPRLAGGFVDAGWQNDVQVRGDVVVSTFDGVVGEPSTSSLCLQTNFPTAQGQGVDIFRLAYDGVTGNFAVATADCVANPPGGAHNATLHPSGDWLAISNSSSDWAVDLVDLRDLANGNATHTYRFIDATRQGSAGRCPVGSAFTCVVVNRPDGTPAGGLWTPHDVFFSEDGDTMYVAAIRSTFLVDVSDALNGNLSTISIIANEDPADPDPSASIDISHQSDTTADGEILVVTDEHGGGVTGTGCNTAEEGKIGAAHFYALAPIAGEPSTATASPANPVKLGFYVNPDPLFAPDELQGALDDLGRAERACTIHVFRIGGNGTSSPGPIQAGFDGVSGLDARQFVTGWYGAGVWHVDFSGRPDDTDGYVEDPRSTWGNTLGFINMPGSEAWSAKEYKGFVYAGDMGRGFDVYGFTECANPIECTLVGPPNNPPVARDDADTVARGGSVVVEVLANDSDPDGDPLTIQSFTQGASGTVSDNLDGTLTYAHNGDAASSDSFTYTVGDGRGGSDTATVSITITARPPEGGGKVTGGGWLDDGDGQKINFGFNAKTRDDGSLHGNLQLNDKAAGVKIHLKDVTAIGAVEPDCGSVAAGPESAELHGDGTYNGDAASFRVCVTDAGEPGSSGSGGSDLFYLECLAGCAYSTGDRTPDDVVDGGNIQVHESPTAAGPGGAAAPSTGGEATVLILGPVLLTESELGLEVLTVTAYDSAGEVTEGVTVELATTSGPLAAVTDATGVAAFTVAVGAGDAEYVASSGAADSNAVEITGP